MLIQKQQLEMKVDKEKLFISTAPLLFFQTHKRTRCTIENQSNYAINTLVYFQAIFPTKSINLATLKEPADPHFLKKKKKKGILKCNTEPLASRILWVVFHYYLASVYCTLTVTGGATNPVPFTANRHRFYWNTFLSFRWVCRQRGAGPACHCSNLLIWLSLIQRLGGMCPKKEVPTVQKNIKLENFCGLIWINDKQYWFSAIQCKKQEQFSGLLLHLLEWRDCWHRPHRMVP